MNFTAKKLKLIASFLAIRKRVKKIRCTMILPFSEWRQSNKSLHRISFHWKYFLIYISNKSCSLKNILLYSNILIHIEKLIVVKINDILTRHRYYFCQKILLHLIPLTTIQNIILLNQLQWLSKVIVSPQSTIVVVIWHLCFVFEKNLYVFDRQ